MALWNARKEESPSEGESSVIRPPSSQITPRTKERSEGTESLIAAGIIIEGKIEGEGHVRIAGHFKGDVHVEGDLTIAAGAHLTGEVRAETIVIAGEVEGNVQATSRVQMTESGMLIGDLKARSLTVAAGSRMRGKVEFGWNDMEIAGLKPNEGHGSSL